MRAMAGDGDGRLHSVVLPRPAPEAGEVLIRVLAVTVNRLDMQMRRHMPRMSGANAVPGCDCAGIVAGHGAGVATPPLGTLVAATARPLGIGSGTYGEWAAVPVRQVAAVPDGVSPEAAACIAFSRLAAYQGMYAVMPEAGETVLVNGAAGAVGHFAIQFGRRHSAWGSGARGNSPQRSADRRAYRRACPAQASDGRGASRPETCGKIRAGRLCLT